MPQAPRSRFQSFHRACLPVLLLALTAASCWERNAFLEVSTHEIDFGNQLDEVSIKVWNSGKDGTLTSGVTQLDYSLKADQTWLSIEPASGSAGEGQENTHVVKIDRTLLVFGNNVATIKISSNGGSTSIAVTAERDLTACSDPPAVPWNPMPANGAIDVPIGADLVWSDGASRCPGLTATYDVYFSTTSPPGFDHNNGSSKYWDPGTLSPGTTYYWRIVAQDANGSTSSAEWSFTTSAAACTAGPAVLTLLAPGNGAISVSIEQNLSWGGGNSQCPGLTATYDVYFGTTSPPPLDHDNGVSKSWDPGTLISSTTYYWQIVAKDANGSTPGPVWSFTTTSAPCTAAPGALTLVAPLNAATSVSIEQDFSWGGGDSQCPGLTATYDVYFGTTSLPPLDHDNGVSKSWDPGTLISSTTYYWQIVAKDANGSTPGPVWSFTTTSAPCTAAPGALTLVAPLNAATSVPIEQDFSWGGGDSECPGLTATYDVYFGTTSPPPLDHNNASAKTWDPGTLINGTTYYWQIVAKDANGSTPGPVWSFTTTSAPCTAAPGALTLVAPLNAATSVSIEQNLSWGGGDSQCPGLTATYDVYFGTTSTPPLDHDNGSAKTWDPGTLSHSTTYYWQIVAKDANGSTPGPVWSFTTTNPPCIALPTAACSPSPTDDREDVNENTNLAWGCGDSQCDGLVATYDVYFGTRSTPGAGEFLGNTAAKAWDLPRLKKEEIYYWQIVTRDANGTRPGPIWRFTTRD